MKYLKYYLALLLILIAPISTSAYSKKIIPGGENVGIEINSKGILVVGFYKVNGKYNKGLPNIKKGDNIIKVNNSEVNSINDFIKSINKYINRNKVKLTIDRNKELINVDFNLIEIDGAYKTGLYVKDRLSGIGTITYIDPGSKIYGALGHEILESNTGIRIEVKDGKIYNSDVTGINKSIDGMPGSKNAKINYNDDLGSIKKNTKVGIYGSYNKTNTKEALDILDIKDVKLGKAYIYTTLLDNEIKKYTINITAINPNSKIKNINFEIIDEELLKQSGGVVQGMSGSPIIQDNKILGAVTHVVIDNVKTGYGIAIKTMLEEGDK